VSSPPTSDHSLFPTEFGLGRQKLLLKLLKEKAFRSMQPLALYQPIPSALQFHKCKAAERLALGSNRSGKTTTAAIEVAMAVTGRHPYLKYPERDGRAILVAKDGVQIGQVLYRKLFRAGLFKMIPDADTGLWRIYDPVKDRHRKKLAKPTPPLIPQREIASISWENKSQNVPKLIVLKNGWELLFCSSLGKPPQGMDADLCLAGWSRIYDPVAEEFRRIDEIDGPFHVLSLGMNGYEVRPATKPFIKSFGEIVRVSLSNGHQIYTTLEHRLLSRSGEWLSVRQAHADRTPLMDAGPVRETAHALSAAAARTLGTCRTSRRSGWNLIPCKSLAGGSSKAAAGMTPMIVQGCDDGHAPRVMQKDADFQGNCSIYSRRCGEHLPWEELGVQGVAQERECAVARTRCCSHAGAPLAFQADSQPDHELQDTFAACHAPHPVGQCGESEFQQIAAPEEQDGWCSAAIGKSRAASCAESRTFHERFPDRGHAGASIDSHEENTLYITGVESCGQSTIWDIGVEENHNYVYGGTVSHNCWFDEEIRDDSQGNFYSECSARLIDRSGRFVWSATPQSSTEQLFNLHDMALEVQGQDNPHIREFHFLLSDNPYLPEEDKALFAAKFANDPEQYRVRILGEFALTTYHVYPNFDMERHGIDYFPIPNNWAKFMVVDPGYHRTAALFFAIPPSEEFVYLYDELYIEHCTAKEFARQLKGRADGQNFQEFIIDRHGSRKHESSGKTIAQQFGEELDALNIRSMNTGSNFILVGPEQTSELDLKAGIEQVRSWLWDRDGKPSRLRVLRGVCPEFVKDMKRYRYKKNTSKPESKAHSEGPDMLRYMVMHDPEWQEPKRAKPKRNPIMERLKEKRRKKAAKLPKSIFMG